MEESSRVGQRPAISRFRRVGRNAEFGRDLFQRKALETTVDDLLRDFIIGSHDFIERQRDFRLRRLPREELRPRVVS